MAGPRYRKGDFAKVTDDFGSFENPDGLLFKDTIVRIYRSIGKADKIGFLYDVAEAGGSGEKTVLIGEKYLGELTQSDAKLLEDKIVLAQIRLGTAKATLDYLERVKKSVKQAGPPT